MMPTSIKFKINKKGFTLIEILVVISIIAILSVIGVVIFFNVQKGARDARRKVDIDTIAKAMEVHYGQCGSTNYCNLANAYFSGSGVPHDPLTIDSGLSVYRCGNDSGYACQYCFLGPGVNPSEQTNAASNGCSTTSPPAPYDGSGYWDSTVQVNSPGHTNYFKTWWLCANLEVQSNGKWYYCISNRQ